MFKIVPILLIVGLLGMSGCVAGGASKPLTPTEVQVITQVIAHRMIAPKITVAKKTQVMQGLLAARTALATTSPVLLLQHLTDYLGPENADIAALIAVLVQERVDLTTLPEIEGKAYLWAILTGVIEGIA